MHAAEERLQIPYRYYKSFEGSTVKLADGSEIPSQAKTFLRREGFFNNLHVDSLYERIYRSVKIGNATVKAIRVRDIVDLMMATMARDPYYLLDSESKKRALKAFG